MNFTKITIPDYKQIYTDILLKKYPHKMEQCTAILNKNNLRALDIMELNKKIFGIPDKENFEFNQRHRSYSKSDIFRILDYQKRHRLNNSQLANHFSLSRNTVTKWKKLFLG